MAQNSVEQKLVIVAFRAVLDFLITINSVFSMARYIGISEPNSNCYSAWSVVVFLSLAAVEATALWKVVRLLAGWAIDTAHRRGLIGRLSGSIFYGNALLSLLFSMKFIASWTNLSFYWYKADTTTGLKLPPDRNIRKRTIVITVFVSLCATEHIMSMISATGLDIPPEEYFERYILTSHGFLLRSNEFSYWSAIPLFLISKIATALWNFQDLIIILISMGLTSRYHRLNIFVKLMISKAEKNKNVEKFGTDGYIHSQVWRRVREAYVRQAALVRRVDRELGALMLLSNVNNLYFICLQLFLGLGHISGTFINKAYYFMSLGWLLFRACSVVLAASDIHVHSTKALISLYRCPGSSYNIEIKRLVNQLTNDVVTLTGRGFFQLNRNLLLQVAAVVLKYELVLLQYDNN